MKNVASPALARTGAKKYRLILPGPLSLLAALLSGLLLFNNEVMDQLSSAIIAVGFDLLRARLIAALLLSLCAALTGAMVGRRKLGAILGASLLFFIVYLVDFVRLQLQPVRDPGGQLELLNSAALVHTSIVMLALAFVSAFLGAAIGVALGEVLLDPPLRLAHSAQARLRATRPVPVRSSKAPPQEKALLPRSHGVVGVLQHAHSWLGAVCLLALMVIASNSGDLFLYSPDIGLRLPPNLHNTSGTIVQDSFTSPALGGATKQFLVYLPPSYFTALGKTRRYPALYLLHGSPGGARDWLSAGKADQSANSLIAARKMAEVILILPDGNGRLGQTSEWGNSFDQKQLIETYVAVDLVKYIDRTYRTIAAPEYRGIGGLSMGGFGAMNIAAHHPDVFGFVISLGGYYRAEGSVWGNNAAYMQENSPAIYIPAHVATWKLHIFLGAATKDQPYDTYARQFAQELAKLHIRSTIDVENGYHSWQVWQMQLYHAFLWLAWG